MFGIKQGGRMLIPKQIDISYYKSGFSGDVVYGKEA